MAAIGTSLGGKNSVVQYSAMIFVGVQAKLNFMNLLSGKAPMMGDAAQRMRGQTTPNTPIVKVMDLTAEAGDKVKMDLFNVPHGMPVMGDKTLTGKGMSMDTDTMEIRIDQSAGLIGTKGRMSQKRSIHNYRETIRPGLTGWASRLEEQRCLIQLAGLRGDQTASYWEIPLQNNPDFAEVMINDVRPSTYNRAFYASNTANSIADLGTGDIFTLGDIERIATELDESELPLGPIVYDEDPYGWENPFRVCFVTARQWYYMAHSAGSDWQKVILAAQKRFDGAKPHPIYAGDCIFWKNTLVRQLPQYAIRVKAGSIIKEATNAATFTTADAEAAVDTDVAIWLGSQALGKAYGNLGTGTGSYFWNEELTDHKRRVEVSVQMMEGSSKLTFLMDQDGVKTATDFGVATVKSYAPVPRSPAGSSALALTKR